MFKFVSPVANGSRDIMVLLNGVRLITQKALDRLFTNLAHTLVVIVP